MSMFDMMFNADEKQKMMDGFALVLSKAVAEGIDAKIEVIEQAVERVLLKHGVIGSLDDVIRQTVSELQPSAQCDCPADKIDGSTSVHESDCPLRK